MANFKKAKPCAGIQPSVRVIQRGKCSDNVAFLFEVLRIGIIALSHVQEILSSLLPFELLLRRNFDFFQCSTSYLKVFCQLFPGNNVHFRKNYFAFGEGLFTVIGMMPSWNSSFAIST